MNRGVKISVVLAVLAVIAMGSLAYAKKGPPVPDPVDPTVVYPSCVKNVACPDVYDPVLCADGVVYPNLCYASLACAPGPCTYLGGMAY